MIRHLKRRRLPDTPRQYLPQVALGQLVSIAGGLAAGAMLVSYQDTIAATAGFFFLLPGFIDLHGNLLGTLSARLHHHIFKEPLSRSRLPSGPFGRGLTPTLVTRFARLTPGLEARFARLTPGLEARFARLRPGPFGRGLRPYLVNLFATVFMAVLAGAAIGLFSTLATWAVLKIFQPQLILIAATAAVAVEVFVAPLVVWLTSIFFRLGLNPDNFMGPFVTSLGDVFGVAVLALISGALL